MPAMALDAPDLLTQAHSPVSVVAWLSWLAKILPDRSWSGVVEFSMKTGEPLPVVGFPQKNKTPVAALPLARKAYETGKVQLISLGTRASSPENDAVSANQSSRTDNGMMLLAIPLPNLLSSRRVLLLKGSQYSAEQQAVTVKLCRWASVWIGQRGIGLDNKPVPGESDFSSTADVSSSRAARLADAVMGAVYRHGTAEAVATAMAQTIKQDWHCHQVSVAVEQRTARGTSLCLLAISDQAEIDSRRHLPGILTSVMQENTHSDRQYLIDKDFLAGSAQHFPKTAALLENNQGHSVSLICSDSKPLSTRQVSGGELGALPAFVLIEHEDFSQEHYRSLQVALQPALHQLGVLVSARSSFLERLSAWFRNWSAWRYDHPAATRRYAYLVASLFLIASFFVQVPFKISAQATIESRDLQVLAAPQEGLVATARARAGDVVRKGDVLATLDVRDLRLAANKWEAEKIKNTQAMDHALAARDRVALGRLRADADRIRAEQTLVDRQMQRSELRAPFDGVVLSGDLSQRLGASVTRGDTLFTIAANDEYRLILDIREQDVEFVEPGQTARVRMAALPGRAWDAGIESILPVAVTVEQRTVFRVPAQLSQHIEMLRPGMEGVARIQVGSQSLAWVYTRKLRDKLRLMLWRMGVIA